MEQLVVVLLAVVTGALTPVLVRLGESQIDRKQRRQDQRDDFRRNTLLELQVAVAGLRQELSKLYLHAMHYWLEGQRIWNQHPLDAVGHGYIDKISRRVFDVRMIGSRANENSLNGLVDDLLAEVNEFAEARSGDDMEKMKRRVDLVAAQVIDRSGTLLKESW
jgi:hypothetical protein